MKKILVAVDGSDASLAGVRLAAEIARGMQAPLELVYVCAPNLLPADVYAGVIAKIEAEEKTFARMLLERAQGEAKGVTSSQVMLSGSPAEAIADHAERSDASMVVVGSRGRGAVQRVLLGSVADRLVRVCKRPVLVAR
ncbi:MAG: universal stress protein, partial [Myxococcota bacterium]